MLTPEEQLNFCKKCEEKTFNRDIGIVCSLTGAKPNFGDSCNDFVIDPVEAQKLIGREILIKEAEEAIKMPVW